MLNKKITISALGDSSLMINFGDVIDEDINKKVLVLFNKLKEICHPYITDIVPAYSSLTIHYGSIISKQKTGFNKTIFEILDEQIKLIFEHSEIELPSPLIVRIPVCYTEKYALDINEIAKEKNISVNEIIHVHTSKKYRVYMIGFLPGFAYMGKVDKKIAVSRKAQPRIVVEAGSVGIAGEQTGIYPFGSPGGWQIIGKTPLKIFDKEKDEPVLLHPGDEIEFYPITEDEFTNY